MNKAGAATVGLCAAISLAGTAQGMGLRSLVALPVEKNGAVIRFVYEHSESARADALSVNAAFGMSANQTLLLGIPYRISPGGANRRGDVSALYRHTVWQRDRQSGTSRLALLAGAITPGYQSRDGAMQSGFVYTHFENRHELDVGAVYQAGLDDRPDAGRYDISWQYRLFPAERPEWGLSSEFNSVMEINGRWREGRETIHQFTVGVQWIHPKWVVEGGVVHDLTGPRDQHLLLSTRFHF